MPTRRQFLQTASLVSIAPTVPLFLARTAGAATPRRDARILVIVQLDGGNDGINTVVPHADEGYARHRKQLRLSKDQLVRLDDAVGLHPALRDLGKLFEAGRLAIVQGVGYQGPSRSHFESMAVWHTARRDPREHTGLGWLGRALDADKPAPGGAPAMVHVGPGTLPLALRSRRSVASALTRPEDFLLDPAVRFATGPAEGDGDDLLAFTRRMAVQAQATAERMKDLVTAKDDGPVYPASDLGRQLRLVARLLKADIGTRVYYTRQPGYDTHAAQYGTHYRLLGALAAALRVFLDDLMAAKLADRVIVLMFSEFGRTVKENGSAGTDHGTSGPVFLAGAKVQGGLVGKAPSLTDLDPKHGDLRTCFDFRRIYAEVLEGWLGVPARDALGATYERLPLFSR